MTASLYQSGSSAAPGWPDPAIGRSSARLTPDRVAPPPLALDRTAEDSSHEVALQREEDDQRQDHAHEGSGGEQVPALSQRADHVGDRHRERRHLREATDQDQ